MIVANMATYPKRRNILRESIERILPQVDRLNLCLNEYKEIPEELSDYKKLNAFIPKKDYKDIGKFVAKVENDDYVLLIDDDIIYPNNYVAVLLAECRKFEHLNTIVGVHGIIYSDLQTENQKLRKVFSFTKYLNRNRVVNQLGTGTVLLRGSQMPSLEYMENSQKFVDVRFAKHLYNENISSICIKREENWMSELRQEESIWQSFTNKWPIEIVREVQVIAGYGKLDFKVVHGIEA